MTSPCPDADELAAFSARALDGAALDAVERHVDACTTCQTVLTKIFAGAMTATSAPTAPVAAVDALPPLRRGEQLGRFTVETFLGRGGMAVVYVAHDPVLDRRVALKVLDAPPHDHARLDEARAMARVDHPNVVGVYDVGVAAGRTYLALELVAGSNVRSWLAQRRRSATDILDVVLQAARGLTALHAAGLVHRDVKPDNLLVGDDGVVRVADLGLVTFAGTDARAAGTPGYAAPEVRAGVVVDARADVYGLCVTLCEAWTGLRPGDVGAAAASLRAARVPRHWHAPVLAGLALAPGDRPASMAALVASLEAPRTRAARRRRAAAAVVAAVAGAIVAWLGIRDPAAACDDRVRGADARLAAVHEELTRTFAATGAANATDAAGAVERTLTDVTARWREGWQATCRAVAHGDESARAARDCQARVDDDLAVLTDVFRHADRSTVEHTVLALASHTPDPGRCTSLPSTPESTPEQRERLARAGLLLSLGRHAEAAALLDKLEAEHPGDAALALVRLARGRLYVVAREPKRAIEAFTSAAQLADATNDHVLAADARLRLVNTVGVDVGDLDAARALLPSAARSIERAGDPPVLRARLEGVTSTLAMRSDVVDAERHARAAVGLLGTTPTLTLLDAKLRLGHILVARSTPGDADALASAESMWREAMAMAQLLEGEHSDALLTARLTLADVLAMRGGDTSEARVLLERAVADAVTRYGADSPALAGVEHNASGIFQSLGDYERALAASDDAMRIVALHPDATSELSPRDRFLFASGRAYSLCALQRYAEAEAAVAHALTLAAAPNADENERVRLRAIHGFAVLEQGRAASALTELASVLADEERLGMGPREVALVRFDVARALHATGKRKRARAEGDAALAVLERNGDQTDADAKALREWLRATR